MGNPRRVERAPAQTTRKKPRDMTMADWETWRPARFCVFVFVTPTGPNQLHRPCMFRVGGADTIEEAHAEIERDRKAMNDSMGGLFEPVGTKGRHYRIFECDGWAPVG